MVNNPFKVAIYAKGVNVWVKDVVFQPLTGASELGVSESLENENAKRKLGQLIVERSAGIGKPKPAQAQVDAQLVSQQTSGVLQTDADHANKPSEFKNSQAQKTLSLPGDQEWPPGLKAYMSKCFSACATPAHFDKVEIILEDKITEATSTNSLWTKEWDKEHLPEVLAKAQKPQGLPHSGLNTFPHIGGKPSYP